MERRERTTRYEVLYRRATVWMLASTLAATVLSFVVLGLLDGIDRPDSNNWETGGEIAGWALGMLTASVIGVLVARKQPHNRIGWLFAAGGLVGCLACLGDQWSAYALIKRPGVLGGVLASHLSFVGLYTSWCLLAVFLPLLFPDGRYHSPRWRWVARFGALCAGLWSTEIFRTDIFSYDWRDVPGARNPLGIPGAEPVLDVFEFVGLFGLFGAMFLAVASLPVRLFRTHGIERQQLKIVAWTAVTVVVGSLIVANLMNALADTAAVPVLEAISWILVMAVPASLGVAVLRYRLYEFDLVIRKTLVYGIMAVFITAVYVAVVAGAGALLGRRADEDIVLPVVATTIAAVAFQPVRERVQRVANRIVFGARATPYEVLAGFAEQVGQVLTFDEVLPRMAEAAAGGVGAIAARAEVFLDDGEVRAARWPDAGAPAGEEYAVEVRHRGEPVGRLAIVKPINDPLRPAELTLLDDVAAQAGVAMRNVQLAAKLQESFEQISAQALELRESRLRLVQAQDAERRKIERDLHDGAQQRLVALSIGLRLALNRAQNAGDPDLEAMLQQAADDLKTAHSELRDLARGIHPRVLTESGLQAAVTSLAERAPVPVTIDVPGERYPPQVEAAAYFVVAEALTNVAKYAGATRASVNVVQNDGVLRIEVSDDGRGGADESQGSGLRGLADRIAALEGTMRLSSPPGEGTTLTVELPCGVTAAT